MIKAYLTLFVQGLYLQGRIRCWTLWMFLSSIGAAGEKLTAANVEPVRLIPTCTAAVVTLKRLLTELHECLCLKYKRGWNFLYFHLEIWFLTMTIHYFNQMIQEKCKKKQLEWSENKRIIMFGIDSWRNQLTHDGTSGFAVEEVILIWEVEPVGTDETNTNMIYFFI